MGTWSDMQAVADAADATISQLQAENAELQRQLDECMEGGGEVTPEPDRDVLQPPTGKLWIGVDYDGRNGYLNITGGELPHIMHEYSRSGSEFQSRLNRASPNTLTLINFKPLGAMGPQAYKDILNGKGDTNIATAATAMKNFGRRLFFAPLHEPENDDSTGASDADYARAFRYIVEMVRDLGADPVVVWNMMGFANHGPRYNALYPGDDVVDWIGTDPYIKTSTTVDTWKEFIDAPSGSFPGFYSWAKPKGKPFMLCEWGIGVAVCATTAPKLLGTAQTQAMLTDFPLCQAVVYWNQPGEGNYLLSNFPTPWLAYTEQAQFDVAIPST